MAGTDGFAPFEFVDFSQVPAGSISSSFDIFSLPTPGQNGAAPTFKTPDPEAGFFDRIGSTFGGIFDFLGSGVEAVGSLATTTEQVTGKKLFGDSKPQAAPVSASVAGGALAGIPLTTVLLIVGGGLAIWLATR